MAVAQPSASERRAGPPGSPECHPTSRNSYGNPYRVGTSPTASTTSVAQGVPELGPPVAPMGLDAYPLAMVNRFLPTR